MHDSSNSCLYTLLDAVGNGGEIAVVGILIRKAVHGIVLALVGQAKVVDHVGVGAVLQVLPAVVAHQAAAAVDAELVRRAAALEIGHVRVEAVGKFRASGLLELVEGRLVLLEPLALGARLRLRAVRAPKVVEEEGVAIGLGLAYLEPVDAKLKAARAPSPRRRRCTRAWATGAGSPACGRCPCRTTPRPRATAWAHPSTPCRPVASSPVCGGSTAAPDCRRLLRSMLTGDTHSPRPARLGLMYVPFSWYR